MKIKGVLGSVLVIMGILLVLFAAYAFLADGRMLFGLSISKVEAIVPFLIGCVFLYAGVGLFKSVSGIK